MSYERQRPVTIAWSSELEQYRPVFEAAVAECIGVLPGLKFYLAGNEERFFDYKDVDANLRDTLFIRDTWTIDARKIASEISSNNEKYELGEIVVIFTKQKISGSQDSPYACFDSRAGIISLEHCSTERELKEAASVSLRYILGCIYLGRGKLHCDNADCIAQAMSSHESILQFYEASAGRSGFCKKCRQAIRNGRMWCGDSPSRIANERHYC